LLKRSQDNVTASATGKEQNASLQLHGIIPANILCLLEQLLQILSFLVQEIHDKQKFKWG
jgi:hypothetical protein